MTRFTIIVALCFALGIVAQMTAEPTEQATALAKPLKAESGVSQLSLGKQITVEGWAVNRKLGAELIGDDFNLWIEGLITWPEGYYVGGDKGKKVKVTGTLAEDHGLPVFVPKRGELPKQGIPVPEGTDLKKASHRYVLRNARWELVTEQKASDAASGEWKKLYADEPWYKDHDQPEKSFSGTLERHHEPEISDLMRSHRYKLGDRFLYPGKENAALEKLIGQKVEIKGKPYDINLEGQAVSEIWPAAVRAVDSEETATLVGALKDWTGLLEANDLKAAQKQWAKDAAAAKEMEEWWANLGKCHKEYDYRNWLDNAEKIGDATQFKVGGHSFGHMHVDWEKTDQGWRIGKVWMCR